MITGTATSEVVSGKGHLEQRNGGIKPVSRNYRKISDEIYGLLARLRLALLDLQVPNHSNSVGDLASKAVHYTLSHTDDNHKYPTFHR